MDYGAEDEYWYLCDCDEGYVMVTSYENDEEQTESVKCPDCNGTGSISGDADDEALGAVRVSSEWDWSMGPPQTA